MSDIGDIRLAVLIDADNVSANYIKPMIEEIARYGNPTIKRIYGDWTRPNLGSWKSILLDFAFQPIQQFGYTSGKNATDSAMIIDAMDILYGEKVDGFCLVSSDSDFTRLATRLREAGKIVYGIGEKKTPTPFISACDRFIYLEILGVGNNFEETLKEVSEASGKPPVSDTKVTRNAERKRSRIVSRIDKETINLIRSSISDLADDQGWAFLGAVGNLVLKKRPSFDSRNFGFAKMSQLVQSIDSIECEERINDKNPLVSLIFVRDQEDE